MNGKMEGIVVENISNIVDKLRSGEVVRCLKCNEGKYITNPKYLKTSHCYWCDKCDDTIHITPADVIVE